MTNENIVASYFVIISQIRGQIQAVDETISMKELVTTKLNALPGSWDGFAVGISSRNEFPSFKELWTSCAQEKSRLASRDRKEENSQIMCNSLKKEEWRKEEVVFP